MPDFKVGQQVEISDGRVGTLKYFGPIDGKAGDFIGIELKEATGKNDGRVQGKRYFDCVDGYGIFVKPAVVSIVAQSVATRPAPARKPARPSSVNAGISRASSTSNDTTLSKRKSLNAPSPSPGPKQPRPSSISRSPTKQLGAPSTSSRTNTPTNPRLSIGAKPRPSVTGSRTSMGPPAAPTRTARPSSTTSRVSGAPTRTASGRIAPGARSVSRTEPGRRPSADSQGQSGDDRGSASSPSKGAEILSPQPTSVARTTNLEKIAAASTTPSSTPPNASRRTAAATIASAGTSRPGASGAVGRENEDLKSKLKVLERKRLEDRDRLKQLDQVQQERDKFEGIIQKLRQKYAPLQEENNELRKELRNAEAAFESIENSQADHDVVLELATLDREMAQEEAEMFKAELDELKIKTEELQLEVEVLRDENEENAKGMSAEEKESANWFQLERTCERQRDALIRLRDISQEQERDLRMELAGLEEEIKRLTAVEEQYEEIKEKLTQSETAVEDLRQQLDNALGAEDMIEDLTERNMTQAEQIEELKAMQRELLDLVEVNDELEINHVQNARELQEELDDKDALLSEHLQVATHLQAQVEDREYTISKFREVVRDLQSALEDMRASKAVSEGESEKLDEHSRAMMDLNMKLQMTNAKTQVKAIDLEMQRLHAEEAEQHLAIIKLFLPDSYAEDKDSVLALLRFRRLAFKANLLRGFLLERVSNGKPDAGHEDDIFAGCEAIDRLIWVSSMCDRFVNDINHCSIEQFAKYQDALHELEPVERALNSWIEGLRRDELKEKRCADELQRTIALMAHLAEVHISEGLPAFANDIHMRATLMQSHLESATTTIGVLRGMVHRVIPGQDETDELASVFYGKCDSVATTTRNTKITASRLAQALEDLKKRSLSIPIATGEAFELAEEKTQQLAELSRQVAIKVHEVFTQDEGRTEPYTHAEVQSTLSKAVVAASPGESDFFTEYMNRLRVIATKLADLYAVADDLNQTQEFDLAPEPWKLRSQELKALKTVPVDAEDELRRLKEEYGEARRTIAQRDEHISTAVLKIDTLEARMRDAQTNIERIARLEADLGASGDQTSSLKEDIERQDRELKALETERDKWQTLASESRLHAGTGEPDGSKAGQERAVATAREMNVLKKDVDSLQSAVRYLREDNRRARLTEQQSYDWLAEPLKKPISTTQQRKNLVISEGKDVLGELVKMATSSSIFDFATLPKDQLAWKPARSTPQYHVAKQMEDYAAWKDWADSLRKKTELISVHHGEARPTMRDPAARLQIRLPGADAHAKGGRGGVEVVGSREWEALRGRTV